MARGVWRLSSAINRVFRPVRRQKKGHNTRDYDGEDVEDLIPPRRWQGHTRPLTKLGYALALLSIFPLSHGGGETVSLTASTEECMRNENGTECVFNSVTLLTLLPAGQPVNLIIRGADARVFGALTFKMESLVIECQSETESYLRSYTVETLAQKRCPGMGSCKGNHCETLLPNETVPELDRAQRWPGNTFCLDSTSFWHNHCGGLASACLYYRNYAVRAPNDYIYEVINCPIWEYKIKTAFSLEGPSFPPIRSEFDLYPGRTFKWAEGNLSLTPSPLGQPPVPALSGRFLGFWDRAALVPNFPIDLHCPREVDVLNMDCTLAMDVCTQCRPDHGEGLVRCHCRDLDIEKYINDPAYALPRSIGSLTLNFEQDRLWATSAYIPVQLALKMEGLRLAVDHTLSTCKITPHSLSGCYKCATGGLFDFSCQSTLGTPLAEVRCQDGTNFVTVCPQNGTLSQATLKWKQAQIDTICEVLCPGGKTNFPLIGTLMYISRPKRTLTVSGQKIEAPGQFELPSAGDFWQLLFKLGPAQIVIICLVIVLGLISIYLFVKFNPVIRSYRIIIRLIMLIFLFPKVSANETRNFHTQIREFLGPYVDLIAYLLMAMGLILLQAAVLILLSIIRDRNHRRHRVQPR